MIFKSVTIVGLGLIGGSLAKALKEFGVAGSVIGVDTDPEVLKYAIENGIVDKGSDSVEKLETDSEVVVLSTYVDKITELAKELIPIVQKWTIITDVGSVKSPIVRNIDSVLREEVFFVGSHPIAGSENSGIEFATPDLFSQKKVIITPTERTNSKALESIKKLWNKIGCDILELDPETHDMVFAYVSHLPHIVAYSLVNSVASISEVGNMSDFSGGGFKDYTRIAASSPEMWKSIFIQNKVPVLKSIDILKKSLSDIENAIKTNDEKNLLDLLRKSQEFKKSGD